MRMFNTWLSFALLSINAADALASDPPPQLLLPPGIAESQLSSINQKGEAVGRCELFDAAGNSLVDFPCLFSSGSVTPIPKLAQYKRMECVAISDSRILVGHAYAPQRDNDPALQAIVFDPLKNTTNALPNLKSKNATLATAISGDGKTIAGVCSGQACIWDRTEDSWTVSLLPQRISGLATLQVCLSDDGKIAVAFQRDLQNAQLAQWTRDDQSAWQFAVRLEAAVTPFDVNNAGLIVGSKQVKANRMPETRGFVLSTNREIQLIEPLPNDNFSMARSVNNHGVVVGWSDGVGDDSKWPRSFRWENGEIKELEFASLNSPPNQAYGINDQGEVAGLLERDDDPHCVGFISAIKPVRSN